MEYKDANGLIYKEGDIVLNSFLGDYWLVEKTTDKDKDMFGLETEYFLSLWGNKYNYCMDINTPKGFIIISRKGQQHYKQNRKNLKRVCRKIKNEERIFTIKSKLNNIKNKVFRSSNNGNNKT